MKKTKHKTLIPQKTKQEYRAIAFIETCNSLINNQTPKQILSRAKALIFDERNWCQGAQARDLEGRKVRINDPSATSWDIEGAIGKVSNDLGVVPPLIFKFLDNLVCDFESVDEDVGWYNDRYNHFNILQFMDQAIKRAPDHI